MLLEKLGWGAECSASGGTAREYERVCARARVCGCFGRCAVAAHRVCVCVCVCARARARVCVCVWISEDFSSKPSRSNSSCACSAPTPRVKARQYPQRRAEYQRVLHSAQGLPSPLVSVAPTPDSCTPGHPQNTLGRYAVSAIRRFNGTVSVHIRVRQIACRRRCGQVMVQM